MNQPAPELSVAEWLSGSPLSIGDLKGKTVALHFWRLGGFDLHEVRLLNALQEVYREKGLVCITICPASTVVETVKQHIAEQSAVPPNRTRSTDNELSVRKAKPSIDMLSVGRLRFVLINTAGEITGNVWDDVILKNRFKFCLRIERMETAEVGARLIFFCSSDECINLSGASRV